jgi:CRP-like cAMP-binding protein
VPSSTLSRGPLAALAQRATPVRARRGQQLSLDCAPTEAVYVVRSGLVVLQAQPPGERRQLLALLYPDDIFRGAYCPPLPNVSVSVAAPAELWRLPSASFDALIAADASAGAALARQLADQNARTLLHMSNLGGLNGEQRVASFLVELALRLGAPGGNSISFDVPLSRTDIADHLALNADTLSRIMSRFKTRGLVAQTGRLRAVIPDLARLRELTPVADTVMLLHGKKSGAGAGAGAGAEFKN